MAYNNDQLRHIAKVFDFLAIGCFAPVLGELTGISSNNLAVYQTSLFVLVAASLEILALAFLGESLMSGLDLYLTFFVACTVAGVLLLRSAKGKKS